MPPGLPEQEAGRGPEATAPAAGRGQRSRPDPFLRPASWSHPEEPPAREKMRPCSALWAQKQRVTALRGRGPGPRSTCPGSPFCVLTVGQHSRTGQAQAPRQRLLPHKAQTPGGSRHVLHSQSHLLLGTRAPMVGARGRHRALLSGETASGDVWVGPWHLAQGQRTRPWPHSPAAEAELNRRH